MKRETADKLIGCGLFAWAFGAAVSTVATVDFMVSRNSDEALLRILPKWGAGAAVGILGLSITGIGATSAAKIDTNSAK